MKIKLLQNIVLVISLALLAGVVGYKLGTNEVKTRWAGYKPVIEVVNKLPPGAPREGADFSLFWKVWDEVKYKYVDKTKLDSQKMVYGAISGMVAALEDPYTVFLPPRQNQEAKEELNGNFEGIGAQLGVKEKRIVIIAPLADSPAQKAGIRTGDWVIKVDGQETVSWTLPEAVAKIRGPRGTGVTLQVLHEAADKPVEVKIIRETIILKNVEWQVRDKIIYLKLARFGDKTDPQWDLTVSQISAYLATTSGQTKGVVLDLRNNPGGYLSGAVYVASEFMSSGVVVKQQSYTGDVQTYSVSRQGKLLSVPLMVLVNQGTASAGEILAGALQVSGRAKVVGTQTFGKGSIQEAEDLPGGTGLHITTAKWLLANDVWINGSGLAPDVKIENDEKALPAGRQEPEKDLQLEKAIEVLRAT